MSDESRKPADAAAAPPASVDAGDGPAGDDEVDAVEAADGRPRYRGWYWLGIVLQIFVWTLIWLGIAIAVGVGGELTEFRYVGF